MATTGTERYVRVTLLTFKGGIWISKKIICREVDGTTGNPTLAAVLQSKKPLLNQKRNHHEIKRKQFELLFPPSGDDTDIDKWDLSLLVKMILILFGPGLPGIERFHLNELLAVRNDVMCHTRDPAITEQEFQSIWTQLIISLNALASSFDADSIQYVSDMIQELSKGPLDLQSSVEKLAQLCRHEEHMENVLASLSRLERRQDQIATGVVSANDKLDDVVAGVKELLRIRDHREQDEYREEIPSSMETPSSLLASEQPVLHGPQELSESPWSPGWPGSPGSVGSAGSAGLAGSPRCKINEREELMQVTQHTQQTATQFAKHFINVKLDEITPASTHQKTKTMS